MSALEQWAVIVMLSTADYPTGVYPYHGKQLIAVDEWPWEDPTWASKPPPELRATARLAQRIDPEDFDGALVPLHALEFVHAQHGGGNPLGWAAGGNNLVAEDGSATSKGVYVYAGDLLVAIVAPLANSPCVKRVRRRRATRAML